MKINEQVIEAGLDVAKVGAHAAAESVRSMFSTEAVTASIGTVTRSASTDAAAVERWKGNINKVFADMDASEIWTSPRNESQAAVERAVVSSNMPVGLDKVRLLEVGPDTSSTVPYALGDKLRSYTAVEISKSALTGFEQSLRDIGVDTSKNHSFIHGNGVDLAVPSQSQDVVYMGGTNVAFFPWKAAHAETGGPEWTPAVAERSIAETARVLAPGGRAIIRPWGSGSESRMDMSVYRKYFSSVTSHGIDAEHVEPIRQHAKYPDSVQAGSYEALVLTK